MRDRKLAALVITATLLAGCSGGSGGTAADSASATSTSASPTPTPATVGQWASKVAAEAPGWKKSAGRFVDECSWIAITISGDPGTCSIQVITMSAIGETVPAVVVGATRELGAPPAEIASLVQDLKDAGIELAAASKSVPEGCPQAGDSCGTAWVRAERAATSLVKALDAWSPYL